MGLIRMKPGWTREHFSAYWRDTHGAIAAGAPGLRDYWQNAVVERSKGPHHLGGSWEVDGFSQLWFDDNAQARRAFTSSPMAKALIEDEARFLGGLHIVTAEQRVVISPPVPRRCGLKKYMAILERQAGMTAGDFRKVWASWASDIEKVHGIAGYRQNIVVQRELVKGESCSYEDLPIDGIEELWFEDAASLDMVLRLQELPLLLTPTETPKIKKTAFFVDERRIAPH
jgi:uncharacterized protein (TIGR02118 family)